jgi:coenzyme F420-0:L-glutamate ligase/coenzyme F420-1:gamma-L-glutamate ligase
VKRVKPGDDLAATILSAIRKSETRLKDDDIVVVTQKIVSKSEGRLVKLDEVKPGERALEIAKTLGKDPKVVELALRESRRVVRIGQGIIITETHHGYVCANSGIDMSNVEEGYVALLPVDPDGSARRIREEMERLTRKKLAVIITDTFGRPWRNGQTDFAIGCSGIEPTENLSGKRDPYGYVLRVTQPAVADEVASASELVMGKLSLVPVAIVRGVKYKRGDSGAKSLVLDPRLDLFR